MIQLLLWLPLVHSQTITLPTTIQAQQLVLYDSNTAMPDQTFSITFTSAASVSPTVVYGLNDYTCGDLMIEENFESSIGTSNTTGFTVVVVSTGSTTPRKFGISYMMFWDITEMEVVSLTYANQLALFIGSGSRSVTKSVTYTFAGFTRAMLTFIRGFSFTTSTEYSFAVTAVGSGATTLNVTMTTDGDCKLLSLSFDVLILYTTLLTSASYYHLFSSSLLYNNDTSATSYTATISNYDTTVFVIGLFSISGQSANSFLLNIGWSVAPSLAGDTATVTVIKSNIDVLVYSFFQVGVLTATDNSTNSTNTTTTTTTSQTSGGSSSIGIILGVIAVVLVIVIVVLLLVRYCRSSKKIYSIPTKDDFRSLPSLTF